ncbi:hypothetical protein V8C26DRAFT_401598 [Trichoderma gracile]
MIELPLLALIAILISFQLLGPFNNSVINSSYKFTEFIILTDNESQALVKTDYTACLQLTRSANCRDSSTIANRLYSVPIPHTSLVLPHAYPPIMP